MRMLSYAVLFVGAMSSPGSQRPIAHASFAPEITPDSIPVDVVLAKQWSELFAGIIQEFQRDNRDLPGNLEGDFTTREIKVRAVSEADTDSLWVSRTLSENELRTGDLEELARMLYANAKRVAETHR
jgi:hypothetical protein